MKLHLLSLGLSFVVSVACPALAVQPAPIGANDKVSWSRVVENPFDGKIVYDRNYTNDFVFVSSWSKSGIRATYTQLNAVLVGYEYDYYPGYGRSGYGFGRYGFGRYRWRDFDFFPSPTPIYRVQATESVPESIQLAINGTVYTYQSGPVSAELAAALASAPLQNMVIRLVWPDGTTKDMTIGKGTVEAWRSVFQPSR